MAIGKGGRGGRGGTYFPDPVVEFTGNNLAATRTARDAYFGGAGHVARLQPFRTDQHRMILLKPSGSNQVAESYLPGREAQAYSSTNWVVRGSASQINDAQMDARITPPARAHNPSGTFVDARIPADIARDAELSAAILALIDGAPDNRNTLGELAVAIAAIVPGATWSTGTGHPAGGKDGDWYLRTGATFPGIYYRSGGDWDRLFDPGHPRLPSVPLGMAEGKEYVLQVASDGDASWIEASDSSGTGPEPPASDTRNHCGTSADSVIDATELAAATSGDANALAIPSYEGRRHIWFLRPAAAGAVTAVYIYESGHRSTQNQSPGFDAVDVTLNGTRYLGVVSKGMPQFVADTIMEVA